MASDSSPPNPPDNNLPISASEPVQAVVNEPQIKSEAPKEISPKSVFVNSEPIREEQVQNAVKFLSHPRVRGSPVLHRRNFLEKKGLTKEEIDEAFRLVPDPSPDVASGQSSTNQAGNLVTNTQGQSQSQGQGQGPIQVMQPVPAVQPGVMSRFHWSHAVIAIGFLATSGAGAAVVFKNSVIPRLKSWIRKVVDEDEYEENKSRSPSLAEETAAAAKAAAAAAADVAKASQEMLITQNEESKRYAEFMSLLNAQLQEMKMMKSAITKLEGQTYIAGRNNVRDEYRDGSITRSIQPMDKKSEYDLRSVRSISPPPSAEPPHPKSYAEIMAMVQRGERPPNVRDIDDRPPNPNQPISNPSLAPRAKPWELVQPPSNSTFTPQSQLTNGGSSYPPQDNGVTYQYNNDNSISWWQQKNTRITEVDNVDGPKFGVPSNGTTTNVGPTQRRWVPPQPPPVQMPEAIEAIRQPKSIPKDTNLKLEESSLQPVSDIDELERITKISESGGQEEINNGEGGSSEIKLSEIREEVTEV